MESNPTTTTTTDNNDNKNDNSNNNLPIVETIRNPVPNLVELVGDKIKVLDTKGQDDAFFICDLGDIVFKCKQWKSLLPRVEPFYAVKCNYDSRVVKLLADLGIGFDCASLAEISQVLELGVSPSRIIYANACKQASFIKYAAEKNVDLLTFDCESELVKIKRLFPNARLVLRIRPISDFKVHCDLGKKFGCLPKNVKSLLIKAQELDLNVMGISFHVGSAVEEAGAYACAVKQAHAAFEMAKAMGFDMNLLDIGGGFPGQKSAPITFEETTTVLNQALMEFFPPESNVRIIAEPGRYVVASAFTLVVNIIAKKAVTRDLSGNHGSPDCVSNDEPPIPFMYYVNDGLYGSFASIVYDNAIIVEPNVFQTNSMTFSTCIWGPTCDGFDCIIPECRLPELEVGNWIFFYGMGAYTMSVGSTFNGLPRPQCFYVCCVDTWCEVSALKKKAEEASICSAEKLPEG